VIEGPEQLSLPLRSRNKFLRELKDELQKVSKLLK
jgi:hypothetical protein